jgi:hypothetical protein
MQFACPWTLGICGALTLGACFDPGQAVDVGDDSEGSSTGVTGSPTTDEPPTTTPPDPTDSTTATTTDEPPTTTDPDTTAGPTGCEGEGPNPTCDPATPYCQDGACVACVGLDEGACLGFDPTTPVCDGETGLCSACTEHDQCATGACRFTTGECFAESNRLWVDNTFGGCAGGTGSEKQPFCTVVEAMDVLDSQVGEDPWAIFVAGSPNPYEGTIDPNGNRPVAIIGPSAGLAATVNNEEGYTLDLWAQSPETYLDHLTIDHSFGGTATRCNSGQVFVTDSAFVGGETGADVTGCTLRLRRSVVSTGALGMLVSGNGELIADQTSFENSSGGILVIDGGRAELRRSVVRDHFVEGGIGLNNGGELLLINSMVYYNQYNNDGVFVGAESTAEVVHSTIIGAFTCGAMAGPTSIRNSIVLGQMFEAGVDCGSTAIDNSVVNAGLGQGMGNVQADAMDLGSIFINATSGMDADWHVMPDSLPVDVAVHQPGDPVVDFDGEPRPTMAGAADYAGADVP